MKRKTMRRDEWLRVIEKEYTFMTLEEYAGEVGLIQINKVQSPLYVLHENKRKCIADNGYVWLQFALDNQNFWLTAMFNEFEELVECYFDITNKNYILPNGDSYFDDLYLDLVFFLDNNYQLLDEDELEEAFIKNEISCDQVNLAYQISNGLITRLHNHNDELKELCLKYYKLLKK